MTCVYKEYEVSIKSINCHLECVQGGGGGIKNLVGESIGEDFESIGENEQIFIYWRDFPHSTSRENSMWVGLS